MEYRWETLSELRSKLFDLLRARHFEDVRRLDVALVGNAIVLRGEVASEQAKSDAKRLALGFERVFEVRNELEVAGHLVAASDGTGDAYFGSGDHGHDEIAASEGNSAGMPEFADRMGEASSDANSEEVLRYPWVETEGDLSPGNLIVLTVDLKTEVQKDEAPVVIGDFPVGWERIEVSVQVFAPWASELAPVHSAIVLTREGSRSAVFKLKVGEHHVAGSAAVVQLSFLNGTRVCGHLSRDLAPPKGGSTDRLPAARKGVDAGVADSDAHGVSGFVQVSLAALKPTLSLTIAGQGDGIQTWMWVAQLAKTQLDGAAVVRHHGGEEKFASELLASCPHLPDHEFRRTMAGIGERIWRAAPEGFRAAYLKCRDEVGSNFPIQLVTADPFVPWEMMKPDSDVFDADHMFFDHPVCRWPLNVAGGRRHELHRADLLSFVPVYGKSDDLPSARAEGEWIETTLNATRMTADRATLLKVLDGGHPTRVGILHFAGHGRADSGVKDGGIRMEDGWVGVNEVDQSRVTIGRRDAPLMVLNACESGSEVRFLGMNTGWGATIANRGFGGLIAPLWEIHDDIAFDLMKAALEPLALGHKTLGEALSNARKAQSDRSISAFAYLAHGDVMARFASRR